jgi:conjugal transfer pilus assembly protein TraW
MTRQFSIVAMLGGSLACGLCGLCTVKHARAEDLGAKAQTYQVDRDAREEFKDVIRHKQSTGELDRFWQDYRDKTIASIKSPQPLGVRTDYTWRTEVNPVRFTIPGDYRNERGEVVVKRGTVVEPLKLHPLTSGLVFIDGRDQAQVDYAIARGQQTPLKIVLTAGSAFSLRVKYQHAPWRNGAGIPFYFDQRRIIIDTLRRLYGIDVGSVPTLLTQLGTGLRIDHGMGALTP